MLDLLSSIYRKIKNALESYRRVLIAARKPTAEEFKTYLKVVIIGSAIIGFIGFLFYLIFAPLGI